MHRRAVVEKIARDLARTYNITEIITPVFEHTVLFQRGVGETTDVVQKEMYTFEDKGGRSITLKPEGTAGVMRAYLEHNLYALSLIHIYIDSGTDSSNDQYHVSGIHRCN